MSQATVNPGDQQEFSDADFRVVARGDQSKKLQWDLASVPTATTVVWNVEASGALALGDGGTGSALADPGADSLMFWDDSAGAVGWLTLGTGLSITGTTINASGGTWTLIQSLSAGTGTTASSSNFTGYKQLMVIVDSASHDNGSNRALRVAISDDNGSNYGTANVIGGTMSAGVVAVGTIYVLNTGVASTTKLIASNFASATGAGVFAAGNLSEATRNGITTNLRFSWNGAGNFDAGTFYIYGLT